MTGYLAFDRQRVEDLRTVLVRSLDELAELTPDDPAAIDSAVAIRHATDRLSPWISRLRVIAGAGALTDLFVVGSRFGPSARGPIDLTGMNLIPDRGPVTTPGELAVVGMRGAATVAALDPAGLDLPAYVAALTTAFATDRPAVTAAILTTLGPDRLAAILDDLSARVRSTVNGVRLGRPEIVATTDLLSDVGRGLAGALIADPGRWGQLWHTADPFLAATVFAGAAPGLGPATASSIGAGLLRRTITLQASDPLWRDAGAATLRGLAAGSETARAALIDWTDAELQFALFRIDPALAGDLLRRGTDPAEHEPAAVERPISRVIEALAALERREGRARFAETGPSDPLDPARWWIDGPSGVVWPVPTVLVPTGIGAILAPWLPYLVGPDHEVGWAAAPGAPVPWGASSPDTLTAALTVPMQHEADALALRLAVQAFFASSLTGEPPTQQHAAYLLGAVEDTGRHVEYPSLAERETTAAGWAAVADLGLDAAPAWVASPLGWGVTRLAGATVPDLRHEMATAEAAGVGVAVSAAALAVSDWRARNAPGSPPLPSLPADDGADPNDRADEHAHRVATVIEEWASNLEPAARAEITALYNRVYAAALAGTAFAA